MPCHDFIYVLTVSEHLGVGLPVSWLQHNWNFLCYNVRYVRTVFGHVVSLGMWECSRAELGLKWNVWKCRPCSGIVGDVVLFELGECEGILPGIWWLSPPHSLGPDRWNPAQLVGLDKGRGYQIGPMKKVRKSCRSQLQHIG